MKNSYPYKNFDELDVRIKMLNLERKIAWEELKLLKTELKQDFSPYNWVPPIIRGAGKYGIFMLVRKLLTRH
ncbi:hypothetical protein [Bizionia myxarmorum]|uniref:Uncharacterized protein n=1 Tax=Bizionia myxarmorum TaxID=291186 RepID=A0A5D0R844_9FLAO|nr:hypothetical protein [Bizionia myxarmorum]TYB77095.1 hypothetical protein ES674_10425 [Bizionia myxarmorum]